jgi:hypothetical protein
MHAPGLVEQHEFIHMGLNLFDDRVTPLDPLKRPSFIRTAAKMCLGNICFPTVLQRAS